MRKFVFEEKKRKIESQCFFSKKEKDWKLANLFSYLSQEFDRIKENWLFYFGKSQQWATYYLSPNFYVIEAPILGNYHVLYIFVYE